MKTENKNLHRSADRGVADHGWLHSHHTFSFGEYYNPERTHFGVLRVLNDDEVSGGAGFGMHPHDNMEIISIPLEGELKHKDSMGNETTISTGEIQVMSAGSGISHTEYNKNHDIKVKFLQIWLFPNKRDVTPRYDQRIYDEAAAKNNLLQILSPDAKDDNVWIHQDAWFSIGRLDKDFEIEYTIKRAGNGAYVFVLEGSIELNGQTLNQRDGLGIDTESLLSVKATTDAKILVMDVPMR